MKTLEAHNFLYNYVKQAVKGIKFLCKDSYTGDTHPDWKRFQYLETGVGTNVYTQVEGKGNAWFLISRHP